MAENQPTIKFSDSTLNRAWRSNVYFDLMEAAKVKLDIHNQNTAYRGSAAYTRELQMDYHEQQRIFNAEVEFVGLLLKRDGLLPREG